MLYSDCLKTGLTLVFTISDYNIKGNIGESIRYLGEQCAREEITLQQYEAEIIKELTDGNPPRNLERRKECGETMFKALRSGMNGPYNPFYYFDQQAYQLPVAEMLQSCYKNENSTEEFGRRYKHFISHPSIDLEILRNCYEAAQIVNYATADYANGHLGEDPLGKTHVFMVQCNNKQITPETLKENLVNITTNGNPPSNLAIREKCSASMLSGLFKSKLMASATPTDMITPYSLRDAMVNVTQYCYEGKLTPENLEENFAPLVGIPSTDDDNNSSFQIGVSFTLISTVLFISSYLLF